MCGHVGVFGKITTEVIHVFEDMLAIDQLRGYDSTGVAFIKTDGTTVVTKVPWLPYVLMRSQDYLKNITDKKNMGMIGHNRAATVGKVTAENAHPFKEDHITFAHNGTLKRQDRLPDHEKYESDSMNLCHAIAKEGIRDTWKKTDGAATIVYWDEKQQTLAILSNSERPFHYCRINDGDTLIWSSEEKILTETLKKYGVAIAGKDSKVFSPIKDRLYEYAVIDKKKGGLSSTSEDLEPFRIFVPPVERHVWQNGQRVWPRHDGRGLGYGVRDVSLNNQQGNVTPINQGRKKTNMTEEEFKKTYKNCLLCDDALEHQFECALIIDDKLAACGDCVTTANANAIRIA